MNKFYCNVCGEEITLQNGKCPKCKTNWNKIINEDIVSEESEPFNPNDGKDLSFEDNYIPKKDHTDIKSITEEDINSNIVFFLRWGLIVKVILAVLGIIIAVGSFILAGNVEDYQKEEFRTDIVYIVSGIVVFIVLILAGIIFEKNLQWKAYMLKNTHEINKKRK